MQNRFEYQHTPMIFHIHEGIVPIMPPTLFLHGPFLALELTGCVYTVAEGSFLSS